MNKEFAKILCKSQLFKGCDEDLIYKEINESNINVNNYKKGEFIAHEDEECVSIGLVIEGSIDIVRIYPSGQEIIIKRMSSKEVFGEALIMSNHNKYPATIISTTDSKIAFISKNELLSLCSTDTKVLENFIMILSNKIIMLNQKIKNISHKSIKHKVLSYIVEESVIQGSRIIKLNNTKEEIAAYIGIPRPSLSRELIKLRDEGIIQFDRKTISLLSEDKIEEILSK